MKSNREELISTVDVYLCENHNGLEDGLVQAHILQVDVVSESLPKSPKDFESPIHSLLPCSGLALLLLLSCVLIVCWNTNIVWFASVTTIRFDLFCRVKLVHESASKDSNIRI